MTKTYYGVFRRVDSEDGEIIEILKDPDFCREHEIPFDTFINQYDKPFLPWLTTYQGTAEAQAHLLELKDGYKYFVGYGEINFTEIAKNTI